MSAFASTSRQTLISAVRCVRQAASPRQSCPHPSSPSACNNFSTESRAQRAVLSASERRWRDLRSASRNDRGCASPQTAPQRRSLHTLPPLPDAIADQEAGCQPFLSADAIQLIGTVWQGGLLQRLNDEVRGTKFEMSSVLDTVIGAAQDRSKILAFNYASLALNNAFFLSNLRPANASKRSSLPPDALLRQIERDFDSLPAFRSAFSAAVMGMVSSGWVWLVTDQKGRLGIVPTFGAGTVLVKDRMQMGNADFQASISESVRRAQEGENATTATAGTNESTTTRTERVPPLTGVSDYQLRIGQGGSALAGGARDSMTIGRQLTPLLVVSAFEHAWLPDYGMWGKEEYMMSFWDCVDWDKVGKKYDEYKRDQR